MGKLKILIVDDEWNMRNLLRIYLSKQGFETKEAANGTEALDMVVKEAFDMIILDVMMPGTDGWEVCKRIRQSFTTPILMLTARTDTKDKVQGLGLGADDYLTKPFEPEELIARVFAIMRRTVSGSSASVTEIKIENKEYVIYPEAREIRVKGMVVELTQKEFDLLCVLAQYHNKVFSRELLVERLWGLDYTGDSRAVDTHIKNIREKLQRAGLSYNPIQTVWGVGYKIASADGKDHI